MRQFAQRILMATLVALYGGATALGPALHALPGLNHVPAALTDTRSDPDVPIVPLVGSHDDCPVCHFLVQGQILVDPDRSDRIEVVQGSPADEFPLLPPPGASLVTHPRAPPAT